MTINEIDDVRLKIRMMKEIAYNGFVRVVDTFESTEFFYVCLERNDLQTTKTLKTSSSRTNMGFRFQEKRSLKEHLKFIKQKPNIMAPREESMSEFEMHIVDIAFQLANNLALMHKLGIVVRDIDHQNVKILYNDGFPNPQIQNTQNIAFVGPEQVCDGLKGDLRFKAPEVALGEPYNQQSDIWTFGILLFYMLTGEFPSIAETDKDEPKSKKKELV